MAETPGLERVYDAEVIDGLAAEIGMPPEWILISMSRTPEGKWCAPFQVQGGEHVGGGTPGPGGGMEGVAARIQAWLSKQ